MSTYTTGPFTPAGTILLPNQPVTFDVTSNDGSPFSTFVTVAFSSLNTVEVIWDGANFAPAYAGLSSRQAITNGYRYTLIRSGGWQPGATFSVQNAGGGLGVQPGDTVHWTSTNTTTFDGPVQVQTIELLNNPPGAPANTFGVIANGGSWTGPVLATNLAVVAGAGADSDGTNNGQDGAAISISSGNGGKGAAVNKKPGNSGNISIQSGNAGDVNGGDPAGAKSGDVSIDVGSASGTNTTGKAKLGATNASEVDVGNSGKATLVSIQAGQGKISLTAPSTGNVPSGIELNSFVFIEFHSDPAGVSPVGGVREWYVADNGLGKIEKRVQLPDGTIHVLWTQP